MRRRLSAPLRQMLVYVALCLTAAGGFALANRYPPYRADVGGLIGGWEYVFSSRPPVSEDNWNLDQDMLEREYLFIVLSLIAGLITLRPQAKQFQRLTFIATFTLEMLLFVCCHDTFLLIVSCLLVWTAATLIAAVLLFSLPPPPQLR